MPRKAKHPCHHPGCPNVTEERFCEEHKREDNRQYEKYRRDPNTRKRYGRAWKRIRDSYVKSHPFCELCYDKGVLAKVEEVHHKIPLSEGGTHARENLISLCKSCVRVISESVASLPLHLYQYTDDGGKKKAIEHPLYHLLHDEPNPEMTAYSFFEVALTHLLLWGNSYSQIIRNGKGEVVALYPLMPDRMTVDRDDKGQLYYEYSVSKDDAPTNEGSIVLLRPEDVLHIPGLSFDGLVGYSPIAGLSSKVCKFFFTPLSAA